jgi:hypothetical protein
LELGDPKYWIPDRYLAISVVSTFFMTSMIMNPLSVEEIQSNQTAL